MIRFFPFACLRAAAPSTEHSVPTSCFVLTMPWGSTVGPSFHSKQKTKYSPNTKPQQQKRIHKKEMETRSLFLSAPLRVKAAMSMRSLIRYLGSSTFSYDRIPDWRIKRKTPSPSLTHVRGVGVTEGAAPTTAALGWPRLSLPCHSPLYAKQTQALPSRGSQPAGESDPDHRTPT